MNTRNLAIGAAVTLMFVASANAGGLLGGVGGGLGGGLARSPNGIGGALDGNIAGHAQFDRDSLGPVRNTANRTKDTTKDTAKNAATNATPPATTKSPEPAAVQTHHVNTAASIDAE